jgi:hypothetical protein
MSKYIILAGLLLVPITDDISIMDAGAITPNDLGEVTASDLAETPAEPLPETQPLLEEDQ